MKFLHNIVNIVKYITGVWGPNGVNVKSPEIIGKTLENKKQKLKIMSLEKDTIRGEEYAIKEHAMGWEYIMEADEEGYTYEIEKPGYLYANHPEHPEDFYIFQFDIGLEIKIAKTNDLGGCMKMLLSDDAEMQNLGYKTLKRVYNLVEFDEEGREIVETKPDEQVEV